MGFLFGAPGEIIRVLPVPSPSHKTLGPLASLAFKIGNPADFVELPTPWFEVIELFSN